MLQITAGNILYCWDKATISPAPENGEHAFKITITTRPRINNRRKYPRMDLNNTCTIKFKNSDTEYAATMENISANGFAFLATDKIFTQSKMQKSLSRSMILLCRIIMCWKVASSAVPTITDCISSDARCRRIISISWNM